MSYTYSNEQPAESSSIDRTALEERGWVTVQTSEPCGPEFSERLLAIARELGTPTPTRSRGSLCEVLLPTQAGNAKPRSLSRLHGVGEFPLHTDTAHWVTPCRYVMLACVSPGGGSRATLLMDTQRLRLNEHQSSLLHSTPLRVTNGRNSFFSTILSKSRPFMRFDPGCMTATTIDGMETLELFSQYKWPDHVEHFQWAVGTVLVLDNWRMLHGRASANVPDEGRKLMRISIR
jgi:hypothetical protein